MLMYWYRRSWVVMSRQSKPRSQVLVLNARAVAAKVLAQVFGAGRSLSVALPAQLAEHPVGRDAALVQELCFGVARFQPRLQVLLDSLMQKPIKSKDSDVLALLLIGLYQLIYMRIPAHAAVAETVAACHQLDKSWASGLANAVLRNYQRQADELQARLTGDESAVYAHPRWLLEMVRKAWPEQWQVILDANNARPPMTLRVNRLLGSRDDYLACLRDADIPAVPVPTVDSAVMLLEPVDVHILPGFAEGRVSVQDAAAQLAAFLLDHLPGQRVLDACAAPGGKTCHILEQQPAIVELVALDSDQGRLQRVGENLTRLQLEASLVCADAGDLAAWWDGRPFDRILLDAPCSATGVIRRHPDIKLLRRPEDIATLVAEQRRLLEMLWSVLRPGGRLVYATCSILPRENARQLAAFIAHQPEAVEVRLNVGWGQSCEVGRQILPGEHGMDGFYYAVLERRC